MIKLVEIVKLAEKYKWLQRFCAAYSGDLLPLNDAHFGAGAKFYVAIESDKELGFIRITNKSSFFRHCTDEDVWCISDAYVKPAYRSKGVLREMITQAVRDLNVQMLYIACDRFSANKAYYFSLYFTITARYGDGMMWAFQSSFGSVVAACNDAYYQKAA